MSPDETAPSIGVDEGELASVKYLMTLLDKTFRTARIYDEANPVARKHVQQLHQELTAYLNVHDTLQFLVQRFELYHGGELVYQNPSPTGNLAFKLYADGIRELSFKRGLSEEDLYFFLETLEEPSGPDTSEEDIVTRLWSKDLSSISLVTAEEIIKSSELAAVVIPQDAGILNRPVSLLKEVQAEEVARQAGDRESAARARAYLEPGLPGFEVSPQDLERLARELREESARDSTLYVLNVLTAILASEKSDAVVLKVLDLFAEILAALTAKGNWRLLNKILDALREVRDRSDLPDALQGRLADLFAALGDPERMKSVEEVLNASPGHLVDDLLAFLLRLGPGAVPSLCTLLGNLEHQEHRSVVCEALVGLAKEATEPLVSGLSDPRWYYVRNLVWVLGRLGDSRLVEHLEPLAQHPDSQVRKEVVRALGKLCPGRDGAPLVRFVSDPEGSIRLLALSALRGGTYTVLFDVWSSVVTHKRFLGRSHYEQRAVFLAIGQTAADEAVPYWRKFVTRRPWIKRQKKEELGALAAEVLGRVGTREAISALEAGQKRGNRAIREACATALASLARRQRRAGGGGIP